MYAQENQFFFPSTIKMYYMKLNDTDCDWDTKG